MNKIRFGVSVMSRAASCKCVISFLWTNALVVGVMVFLMFTFVDPADIAVAMMLDVDESVFRVQAYVYSFLFMWVAFSASTFLNCYFARLKYNMSDATK